MKKNISIEPESVSFFGAFINPSPSECSARCVTMDGVQFPIVPVAKGFGKYEKKHFWGPLKEIELNFMKFYKVHFESMIYKRKTIISHHFTVTPS